MNRIAVIGAGHFGREHARVYSTLEGVHLVAVCDVSEKAGRPIAGQFGVEFVEDFRNLIGRVDAASVVAPTTEHHRISCELLDAGISVLVEKPIARTVAEADEMIAASRKSGAIIQVGHLERFNPAVRAASEIATSPRFFEGDRLSVFTPRSLDIDVVMDLMIHDIDVVLSLVKAEVTEVRAAGVPILTSRIDIANARLEFSNGAVANLTASRVSGDRVRKLRFFQPHEYVSIDYSAQEASVVRVGPVEGRPLPEFQFRVLPAHRDEPLKVEISSFLAALDGEPVEVTGEQARDALAVALSITDKVKEHLLKTQLSVSTALDVAQSS